MYTVSELNDKFYPVYITVTWELEHCNSPKFSHVQDWKYQHQHIFVWVWNRSLFPSSTFSLWGQTATISFFTLSLQSSLTLTRWTPLSSFLHPFPHLTKYRKENISLKLIPLCQLTCVHWLLIALSAQLAISKSIHHLCMPSQIAEKMMSLVSQYGVRLWKLRVTEAEIKITIRWVVGGSCTIKH